MRRAAIAIAILITAAAGGTARATDTKETARKAVVDLLDDIGNYVARASENDGGARLTAAVKLLPKLDTALDKYEDLAEGDKTAEATVKTWRGLYTKLKTALDQLVKMRVMQMIQNDGPKKCQDVAADLKTKIPAWLKATTAQQAQTNSEALIKEAQKWGPPITKGLAGFDDKRREIEGLESQVKSLSTSDRDWAGVFANCESAADEMSDSYRGANEKIHDACDRLAKGEDNPDVKDALLKLKRLKDGAQETAETTKEDYKQWLARIQDLAKWQKGAEEDIRKAMCGADEDPRADMVLDGEIITAAKRASDRMSTEWKQLDAAAQDLINRFTALKDKDTSDEIAKRRKAIDAAANAGILRGANHPKIRTVLEVGKNEHKNMQKDCDGEEITITGKPMRIDCVNVNSKVCMIIEIKPDTTSGKAKAMKEAEDYEDAIQEIWVKDRAAFKTGALKIFEQCEDKEGNLITKPDEAFYAFCPKELELDPIPTK